MAKIPGTATHLAGVRPIDIGVRTSPVDCMPRRNRGASREAQLPIAMVYVSQSHSILRAAVNSLTAEMHAEQHESEPEAESSPYHTEAQLHQNVLRRQCAPQRSRCCSRTMQDQYSRSSRAAHRSPITASASRFNASTFASSTTPCIAEDCLGINCKGPQDHKHGMPTYNPSNKRSRPKGL